MQYTYNIYNVYTIHLPQYMQYTYNIYNVYTIHLPQYMQYTKSVSYLHATVCELKSKSASPYFIVTADSVQAVDCGVALHQAAIDSLPLSNAGLVACTGRFYHQYQYQILSVF